MVYLSAITFRRNYGPGTPQMRHDHACCLSRNTAIAGFDLELEHEVRDQSQDGGEVAEAPWC